MSDSLPKSSGQERKHWEGDLKTGVVETKPVIPALTGLSQKFKASLCDGELKDYLDNLVRHLPPPNKK